MILHLKTLLPAACLIALGAAPLQWLVGTWYQPGYEGIGIWAFAATAALLWWSISSAPTITQTAGDRLHGVLPLLIGSLLIRLLSTFTGVNLISALVLAIDVYALARLLGTGSRERAVAPLWLAIVFCFSLPLEPLLQRTVGFALQQVSAMFACGWLELFGFGPQCHGVRLQIEQTDVLVDLPCSGARLASFGGLIFALLAALRSPSRRAAAAGLALLVGLVALGNSLRIAVLAAGIANSETLPFDVMVEPWHSVIGLVALSIVAVGLWCWFERTDSEPVSAPAMASTERVAHRPLVTSACVLVAALALPFLQPIGSQIAVDSQRLPGAFVLPAHLGGHGRMPVPLSALESAYFRRYGASASRGTYGPHGLYIVRTNAPLRHLHAPEICLRGLGHRVEFVGTAFDGVPRSQFRSTDVRGNEYRVAVTYVADDGALASSIAEVVWHWIQNPRQHWTTIQRISPMQSTDTQFEHAVRRAFNLPAGSSI